LVRYQNIERIWTVFNDQKRNVCNECMKGCLRPIQRIVSL